MTGDESKHREIFNSLIEEAITSSQIEGASTTRVVTAEMLRSGRRPVDCSETMMLNNFLAALAAGGYLEENLRGNTKTCLVRTR